MRVHEVWLLTGTTRVILDLGRGKLVEYKGDGQYREAHVLHMKAVEWEKKLAVQLLILKER